jgi:hypothetical protein
MTTAREYDTDALLAAILRRASVSPHVLAVYDPQTIYDQASQHDVVPLIADRLARFEAVPAPLRALLHEEASRAVVMDMAREGELRRFLAALDGGGVGTILIKGTHLAYSHYPRPDLRSRIDTDVLIQTGARDAADDLLTHRLGYVASVKVSGDLSATQKLYVKYKSGVPVHLLDVHWRLSSPQVFANVLSYDELAASAVALPRIGPTARGPSDVHALLIACVHRVAHHLDAVRFKWLYDIDLIATGFTQAQWDEFARLAVQRRVAMVCRRSLERTAFWFQTAIPPDLWSDSRSFSEAGDREVSAAYLEPRALLSMVLDDLRALPTWRDRARLAGEHLFPSATYMRTLYAPGSAAPLPILYAVRFLRGAKKWVGL